jgi:hypothetical protein
LLFRNQLQAGDACFSCSCNLLSALGHFLLLLAELYLPLAILQPAQSPDCHAADANEAQALGPQACIKRAVASSPLSSKKTTFMMHKYSPMAGRPFFFVKHSVSHHGSTARSAHFVLYPGQSWHRAVTWRPRQLPRRQPATPQPRQPHVTPLLA